MFKRGGIFWCKIRHNGRIIQESLGTKNKKLATAIENKIRSDLTEGKYFDCLEERTKTFADLAKKYEEEVSSTKAKSTQLREEGIFRKHLIPAFGSKLLINIRAKDISAFKSKRKKAKAAAQTINHELKLMKSAFNVAIKEWEWCRDNPVNKVKLEKLPRGRVRYLSEGEFSKLYDACEDWIKPIVMVARYTGLRMTNVLELTWRQINFQRRDILVLDTKNGEPMSVPLCKTLYDVLVALKHKRTSKSERVFPTDWKPKAFQVQVRRLFYKACKKVGISNFRWHDLRHDFASQLVQKGVDLYRVQRLLGHKDSRMTQRYAHLSPNDLSLTVKLLDEENVGYNMATIEKKREQLETLTA